MNLPGIVYGPAEALLRDGIVAPVKRGITERRTKVAYAMCQFHGANKFIVIHTWDVDSGLIGLVFACLQHTDLERGTFHKTKSED